MRSAISPSLNVRPIRSIASTLLCFAILFAAEAPTLFACTSTYLDVCDDATYVYADASMSVSGCNPCYAQIDLTLTSPTGRSGYTSVSNDFGQTSIEAVVPLPINAEYGTWTGSADYTTDNLYQRTQSVMVCGFNILPGGFHSNYCTNPVEQDLLFSAAVVPSLSQCPIFNFSTVRSCSAAVEDGNMNLSGYSCNYNGAAITGHAYFFGSTGHMTLGFNLQFSGGNNVSKTSTIEVVCP
jgi:hypothetical protein